MNSWGKHCQDLYPTIIGVADLKLPAAAAMARLLGSGAYDGAALVECRGGNRNGDAVTLLLDVQVELGQKEVVNDIRHVERMAFVFVRPDALPSVYATRSDFPPRLPHMSVSIKGWPSPLCLFDMAEGEAIRFATPLVLVERVRAWLRDTAFGRLHQDDQPLDPLFMSAGHAVVLPRGDGIERHSGVLRATTFSDQPDCPIFLELPGEVQRPGDGDNKGFSSILMVTQPLPHGQLQMLPSNVAELLEVYGELGVDVLSLIRQNLTAWKFGSELSDLLARHCLLIIGSPIERSPGVIGDHAWKAFITTSEARELAVASGTFATTDGITARLLVPTAPDGDALCAIKLMPLDVYRPFGRAEARVASGLPADGGQAPQVTLVGAGALGSQIAIDAARSGLGQWHIIDPDHLMPHNMARHVLTPAFVGSAKAQALAWEINNLLGPDAATFDVCHVERDGKTQDNLASADLVVDASASVPTARWMATEAGHSARTASVFLNPSGLDLVIMSEGQARLPRIDHLEMSYYWEIANNPAFEGHLASREPGFFPSGGCRRPSLRIPQHRVAALAAVAAKRLLWDQQGADGSIEVWQTSDGGITRRTIPHTKFTEAVIGDWTIAVNKAVLRSILASRRSSPRAETGGILVGVWDRVRKKAYIAGCYDPPPDSISEFAGFVRGSEGLYETLETVERRTAHNLTYCGEWHTHPSGYPSRPSGDDRNLLRWIGDVLVFSDAEPLMLIAGDEGVRLIMGSPEISVILV